MEAFLKFLIKKDLKYMLPGFAMFVMAGLALCLISAVGIFSGNGNFAISALYIFFYAMLVAVIYNAVHGANILRKNLGDDAYMKKISDGKLEGGQFFFFKLLQSWGMGIILVLEYMLLFGAMLLLAEKKLGEKNGVLGLFDKLKDSMDNVPGGVAALLVMIEGILLSMAVVSLCFLAFSLCFKFFLRGQYAFAASLMSTLTMLWLIWKVFDLLVPSGGILAVLGTILFCFMLSALFSFIYIRIMKYFINDQNKSK